MSPIANCAMSLLPRTPVAPAIKIFIVIPVEKAALDWMIGSCFAFGPGAEMASLLAPF
jgi:hypothetical protein